MSLSQSHDLKASPSRQSRTAGRSGRNVIALAILISAILWGFFIQSALSSRKVRIAASEEFMVALAHAIEHGELAANVKRWATEQWEGRQLPGNINRLETFIERADLAAWQGSR